MNNFQESEQIEFKTSFGKEVKETPDSTFKEISKQLSISHHTVKEYVKRLKDKGLIKRIGSSRSGYWAT